MSRSARIVEVTEALENLQEKLDNTHLSVADFLEIQSEFSEIQTRCNDITESIKYLESYKLITSKLDKFVSKSWTLNKKPDVDKFYEQLRHQYPDGESINFKQFGLAVSKYFAIPPTINFFTAAIKHPNDNIEEEEEESSLNSSASKRKSRRVSKMQDDDITKPSQVINEEDKQDTRKNVKKIKKTIEKKCEELNANEVDLIPVLTSKEGFSKTIENFFDASILISTNAVGLDVNDKRIPVLQNSIHTQEEPSTTSVNHTIWSINSKAYKKLVDLYGETLPEDWDQL